MLLNIWCVYAQQRYLRKKENFWVSWSTKHHNLAVRELNMSTLHISICKFNSWWKVSLDYQLNLYQQRMQSRNAWFLLFYLFTPKIEMWKNEIKNYILCLHWEFPCWFLFEREKNITGAESQPGLPKFNPKLSFCVFLILCDFVKITFVKYLVIIVESRRKSNNRMCLCNIWVLLWTPGWK